MPRSRPGELSRGRVVSLSTPFIERPVATTLLTVAIALAGAAAFRLLPVAPLPEVDFPTIQVTAQLPGADPQTMASSVATPLERQFGRIAGLTELTSSSALGTTNIVLQFDLNRNIDAAARSSSAAPSRSAQLSVRIGIGAVDAAGSGGGGAAACGGGAGAGAGGGTGAQAASSMTGRAMRLSFEIIRSSR